tara:strand:- start:398 stop:1477 length:1080 start_codon:yes stop_codon:yes gene_type:complete
MQIKLKLIKLSRLYIFFLTYVLIIIFFSTTFLYAKTFKVSNLEISEPFELNFDKNKVIDKGFRLAFLNLISMITTSTDKKMIQKTSLREIKGIIDSFTISKEKFIDEIYIANLDVVFNKKNTLDFLENKNIFPSVPIKRKVLFIPIEIDLDNEDIFLFSDSYFFNKWNEEKKNFHLIDYILPNEDLEELRLIQKNLQNIEDYDFIEIIKKYDLENYIIAIFFKQKNELRVLSKINFNNSLRLDNKIFPKINIDKQKTFNKIIEKLKTIYEDSWKKDNQINTSIKLPLTISIKSTEYSRIEALENTLNDLDLVSGFNISKFNNEKIFYRIVYNGSPKKFLNDMMKFNFEFITAKKIWEVK